MVCKASCKVIIVYIPLWTSWTTLHESSPAVNMSQHVVRAHVLVLFRLLTAVSERLSWVFQNAMPFLNAMPLL